MPRTTAKQSTRQRNPVFRALADDRRRRILSILGDRTSSVGVEELAVHLAAAERGQSLLDVTDAEVKDLRGDLRHVQLPALVSAGLVDWDVEAGTVTTTDHPAFEDPKFGRVLEADVDGWDAVLAALEHRRRRVVLSVLEAEDAPIDRTALASAVAARERDARDDTDSGTDEGATDENATDENATEEDVAEGDVAASLHHVHLPELDAAGLVDYDADAETVTYEGHPALEEEWLDSRPAETPRAVLPRAEDSEEVWTIEGRDNVIARGQSLFEQADDELFLMFTTDGLLEEGCLRRLEDAIDRGVDVYVGSQTADVRDLVRERVPGAVIWEPQMDWLNLPPEYERVGRLVFADRGAIMLATLGEETEMGVAKETAITGAGRNNPLVALVRELLGSRLDHLDAQSEDFLSKVPL